MSSFSCHKNQPNSAHVLAQKICKTYIFARRKLFEFSFNFGLQFSTFYLLENLLHSDHFPGQKICSAKELSGWKKKSYINFLTPAYLLKNKVVWTKSYQLFFDDENNLNFSAQIVIVPKIVVLSSNILCTILVGKILQSQFLGKLSYKLCTIFVGEILYSQFLGKPVIPTILNS